MAGDTRAPIYCLLNVERAKMARSLCGKRWPLPIFFRLLPIHLTNVRLVRVSMSQCEVVMSFMYGTTFAKG
jgi:hypothetical protein